jgi:hypothetical protein
MSASTVPIAASASTFNASVGFVFSNQPLASPPGHTMHQQRDRRWLRLFERPPVVEHPEPVITQTGERSDVQIKYSNPIGTNWSAHRIAGCWRPKPNNGMNLRRRNATPPRRPMPKRTALASSGTALGLV